MPREANTSVLVQKHLFHTAKLELDTAESIPATIGYETYGQLNARRDNAVLICHDFAGSSHAAGRYSIEELSSGWWDALIGPGKAFDTDRYYVIAVDSLCNLHPRDPRVVTTGPASIDPATGRPYGAKFPQISIRDNVRLQRQLLDSLGVERLTCVAGPGMGGFTALEWAVTYPHAADRIIAAAATPQAGPVYALSACQAGIDAIQADPAYADGSYVTAGEPLSGLRRALYLRNVLTRSDAWISGMWERKTAAASTHPRMEMKGRFAFQAEMAEMALLDAYTCDADHFIYTARACLLHDIGYGNRGLEVAAQLIRADLLLLPVTSDLICPTEAARSLVELVNVHGGRAELAAVESLNGHQAAVDECSRLAEPITRWMRRHELH